MAQHTFHETIEEDLARAKRILRAAEAIEAAYRFLPGNLQNKVRKMGYIPPEDRYPAYQLLRSFVSEIEQLRAAIPNAPSVAVRIVQKGAER